MNRLLRNILLILLIITTSNNSYSQTCVIGVWTKDAIYFGADSRTKTSQKKTNPHAKDVYFTVNSTACKIAIGGNIITAIAGVSGMEAELYSINCCVKSYSLKDAVNRFTEGWPIRLKKEIEDLKNNFPKEYEAIDNTIPRSEIMFGGFENDQPVIYYVAFNVIDKNSKNMKFKISTQIISQKSNLNSGYFLQYMGHHKDIDDMDDAMKIQKMPPKDFLELMIKKESTFTDNVGLPVSVLKMDRNNVKWLTKNKVCN